MKSGCEAKVKKDGRSIALPILSNASASKNEIRKSKTSFWRAVSLIVLYLLMIAHFVQWRLMGTTVSPIEPSESMFTLQNGLVNAGFIFFSLAILATLILGRFVCGWGCHIVALQDLCAWVLKKFGLTPKPFRSRLLVFVPLIVALYMFVWPTVSRLFAAAPNEKVIPQFTNHIITTEFWATFPTVAVAIPFLFICGFMTVVFLGSKGFCTYGCPYGGFFGVAERVAPGRIRVTDACNQCGHCTATCTSNVIVHAEVKQYGMVVDPGCMKCMDCISVCPNDALYFGFGKPAVVVPERKAKKNFSLTWPEEFLAAFVFFASLMAVWDVYQLVPMLMALGIAGVTTFLAISLFKLLRDESMFFYGFTLRSAGKIKTAGLAFLVFSALWIGLNIHSGYVSYHERAGAIAYENIRIPDELALAGTDPKQWLSPTEQKNIAAAKTHFADASSVGLFINKEALSKQAWVEYLAGNTDRALELLGSAAENQSGQGRALSLYYRGAILNRIGRFQDALAGLEAALNETPDLIVANEEKGESLWQLGRRDEAVAVWSETVKRNPNLPLANNFLAGAAEISGDSNAAAAYQNQADRTTPRDPYFHRMLGLRLNNLGMDSAAERHFQTAIKLDPSFRSHSKGR